MNKIETKITFKEYQFSRVKPTSGTSAITYTDKAWVDETVSIIPMGLTVTDRLIETCYNNEKEQYELYVETDVIFKKTINKGANVGRIYLPTDYIGVDVLIIKAPVIQNLY